MTGPALASDAPLAIALGDPAGIGPELILAAWQHFKRPECLLKRPFFVVGGLEVLRAASQASGIDCPLVPIAEPAEAALAAHAGLPVMAGLEAPYTPGRPTADGARLALASLEYATRFALGGEASALVTAPVAKKELVAIGFAHPGQTEFLAAACGRAADDAVMMLAGPSLRTVPVTVHAALADVPRLLTTDLIIRKSVIAHQGLIRDFGLVRPRLAVAGLNPHAGEEGQFGDEEARIIAPAIAAMRAEGIDVRGPIPADALFMPRARATYDVAICMYHDQALIPLKALEVDDGVNVTLGLPIIRTSPDHGTAFDIAGKGLADPGAMKAAIAMAAACAEARMAVSVHG
ncbi:MAG: 4-hydroxythreonine-4-phosphate dehydrogenase PdxA [Erythrobacter sp.]|jgi:4-hydroxythreonine-4-phosphate dehydrogenase|nr:4-hydroxythreonine-4-phosphate dehydrogenase PdxA [Erythrobacter sp.]